MTNCESIQSKLPFTEIEAQVIYDLREKFEFCSGQDLHEFFQEMVDDPSPSGSVGIPTIGAQHLILSNCNLIEANSSIINMEDCRIAWKATLQDHLKSYIEVGGQRDAIPDESGRYRHCQFD